MTVLLKSLEAWVLGRLQGLLNLSRPAKNAMIMVADAVLCVLAVCIAFSLRLGEWQPLNGAVGVVIILSLSLWLPIFLARGIYRSIVRFAGARTMANIAISCLLMGIIVSLVFTLNPMGGVPRTIGAIQAMVFAMLLIVSRSTAAYVLLDVLNQRRFAGRLNRVLIYGAGSAGRQLAMSLRHEPGITLHGYIEDDNRIIGKWLDGVAIYHSDRLEELVSKLEIDTVLLAIPGLARQRREVIVRKFDKLSVHVLTLPGVGDLVDGSVSIADLREVEIEDLLGRDPVPPDDLLLHKTITGRSVMVTGAGGSIGSELCRQIARLNPASIILVEMTEHALYLIESELREAQRAGRIEESVVILPELGNVADPGTVRRLFARWRPDTVFHAAAYKHVPLVEENVIAGMRNNIFGTLHCAREAERIGVKHFILVSTDKAVRPTNVMGATKRVCELVLQALSAQGRNTTFTMVRFGNVLGSSGSVVPRFQSQIRAGGPVTLTHREVTRYFMTVPEAAQLVIQAGAMAEGGEVYLLDMGEPIKIYDLARTMINLSGLTVRDANNPDGDIEIHEIGLRKGEKLYEELLIGNSPRETSHPRIMQGRETFLEWSSLSAALSNLDTALGRGNREEALGILSELVPEYSGEQSRFAAAPKEFESDWMLQYGQEENCETDRPNETLATSVSDGHIRR